MASALFGQSTASNTDSLGIGADILAALAKAKAGVGADVKALTADPKAPLAAAWEPGLGPSASAMVENALKGRDFFDTGQALFADLRASGDYRRLFALHSGIGMLQALASRAGDDSLSRADRTLTEKAFARGLSELDAFFASQRFEDVRIAQGDRIDSAQTTLALPIKSEDYLTGLIHRGSLGETLKGLSGDARFNVVVTPAGGTAQTIAIDLAEMGSIPRSLGNVISFVNGKLTSAGAATQLAAADQTPKTNKIVVAGRVVETRYTGAKQYALKVDVRAGERVAFEPVAAAPAFYAVGMAGATARLIKLENVEGEPGQAVRLDRPAATASPIGAHVATGWIGPGAPYAAAPAGAYEQRTTALLSDGENNFETALRAAGEAVLNLQFADGRTLNVTTAWRDDDVEAWRQRSGESADRAIADDLAERLTQVLHEQGVAAGVEVWEDGDDLGFSIKAGDLVTVKGLTISGRAAVLTPIDPAGMTGGLRDGVFARRFEAAAVANASDLFTGAQTFSIETATRSHSFSIDTGADGVNGATFLTRLNEQLRERGINAAASLFDNAGVLALRIDALHDVSSVSANINGGAHTGVIQAPGAWASGGLPVAAAGQPFGDAVRSYDVAGGAPLLAHAGALDIAVVVATPTGAKTISVSVSALERASDPDPSPGEWSAVFQARLDSALNEAGVYVGAQGADLMHWTAAESAGHRITSVTINGAPLALTGAAPSLGLGGAFAVERSFTSAEAATGVSDVVADLVTDQAVSLTFRTVWGQQTVSAVLQPGDARTLESAALRLNEALASAGYDLGVVATAVSGGGAGLRIVAGDSHTIRAVQTVRLGGQDHAITLDPIDAISYSDDPVGAARVADRAARGAVAFETTPSQSALSAPTVNPSGWFPGRIFDVQVGADAKVGAARAVAAGADGSVYVLADLSGDTAATSIRGARDVALLKYDSAGKLLFTEILGASQTASGFALAVAADGKVAIAGSVEGALGGADAARGGADSFVTMFDANGGELWTQRRAATANDEARAIAFAPDGSVVVAGKADSALGPALALGGADGYVRGFSSAGAELFTRQFGTAGEDAATALFVRDDGAGGLDIFTGGVEDGRGMLRRFSYNPVSGAAAVSSRDIGYFHSGAVNTIVADGGALYVGGQVGADRLELGAPARAAIAGKEGFVARVDAGLVSAALDRTTYLGSAQDDAVKSIAIVGGQIYAAGVSGGLIAGQGVARAQSSFLSRIDASGGEAWTRTFNSAGGLFSLNGLAVDASGASPLDVLGLPRGAVAASDPGALVSRSALRVGDEFRIGVDGRRMTTVRVAAGDTLASLMSAVNRAIAGGGRAEILKENGVEKLKITARDGQAVRIEAGRDGRDALQALGLSPGIVAVNTKARGALKTFGLGIASGGLKLDSKGAIASARAELSAALSLIRQAYDTLLYPNAPEQTEAEKALEAKRQSAGPAPEYLTAQLANYQAALARLGG